MTRIAWLALVFFLIRALKLWPDYGGVVVMLAAYVGFEAAFWPDPGPSEQGEGL
jgi:hypothetical protein